MPLQFLNRLYQTDVETADGKDWKEEFKAVREREPPDSWDADFPDGAMSPQTPANKPWKGAATFIPKVPSKACSAESKRVRFLVLNSSSGRIAEVLRSVAKVGPQHSDLKYAHRLIYR